MRYHDGSRRLQDAFDTRRLADRIDEVLVQDRLTDSERQFIEGRDMFFLATADAEGQPSCSYKGGDPGFVRVIDEKTIAFPSYDGNGMFLSAGNVLVNARVGMLFIDFEEQDRLRVNGTAEVVSDEALRAMFPGAQFVIRVTVGEVFPNCGRYIHRYALVERSTYVPREGCKAPIPGWKRSDWAADVLAADDPANES
jgi:predicted pyridoxine 5'-phosphate oxidase superfamily flavin-nucleotide-binding protein